MNHQSTELHTFSFSDAKNSLTQFLGNLKQSFFVISVGAIITISGD